MIPLQTADQALPMGLTGGVVLLLCLLVTAGWLAYLYR